jgi:FkbM family methyltransferase
MQYLMRFSRIIKNPFDLVLQYLGLWGNPYIAYRMSEGGTILGRAASMDDRDMLLQVFGKEGDYNAYAPKPGDVVLDIGAYIGAFSMRAARSCSRVIAYEPHPENYRMLVANLHLNGLYGKVTPFRQALSERPGRRALYSGDFFMGFSLYKDWRDKSPKKEVPVECVTLKEILDSNRLSRVDLLKLDCEGAEYPALMKADSRTLSKIRRIIMEHHVIPGHPRKDIIRRLIGKGFAVRVVKEVPGCSIVYATRD